MKKRKKHYTRLRFEELKYEACVGLIAATLEMTFNDYCDALNFIKANRSKYKGLLPKEEKHDKWYVLKNEFVKASEHKTKTPYDKKIIKRFACYGAEPPKLTKAESNFLSSYRSAVHTKCECEHFYTSESYVRLTMNKGITGKEVIEYAKRQCEYE